MDKLKILIEVTRMNKIILPSQLWFAVGIFYLVRTITDALKVDFDNVSIFEP